MKKAIMLLSILFYSTLAFCQATGQHYPLDVEKAASLFAEKNYKGSALAYSDAFKGNGGLGTIPDRYDAACAWALAGNPDSAFFHLQKVALRGKYINYNHLNNDVSLKTLHQDKRWQALISAVKENKDKLYPNLDLSLSEELDSILAQDTKYRVQLSRMGSERGPDSTQVKDLWVLTNKADSMNVLKVTKILDEHGWLGPAIVGSDGNQALFLVIQHAGLKIQQKYLPLLQDAVKKGNAQASQLALLTDRIALRNGKKQIYGSQLQQDPNSFKYSISPLEDPDHVDERRAKMGLGPLADYVRQWKIKWDVNEYKKSLEERAVKK